MDIFLNFGSTMQLPVLPSSFKVKSNQNNTEVIVNDLGAINLLGKRGLKEVEIATFFPASEYDFCQCTPDDPYEYCRKLDEALNDNVIGVITITGTIISLTCTIDSFEYGEEDGSGDVSFTLVLKEYRAVSSERIAKATKASTYTTQSGDTFYAISRKVFGNSAYASDVAKANGKKVTYTYKKSTKIKIPAV